MIGACVVFEFTLGEVKIGFKKIVGNVTHIDGKGSNNQLCRP